MTITNFSIEYDAINSKNIFTNGDTINGRIIVEASKETQVQTLTFIASGKARVIWTEHYGQYNTRVYWADEKYYEVKHRIVSQHWENGSDFIGKGRHVFPFTFQIPDRKIPSSFKDGVGKIVHKVQAELKQSMKLTKKAKAHFTFVSKADLDIPGLMEPQSESKDKTITFFGSGIVTMDVHTNQMGYMQGEAIKVTVAINNNCSRSVKPKFVLYEKKSYFAQGHRRVHTKDVLKEKVDAVASGCTEMVKKVITVPCELPSSITNCSILTLEYRLKVYLNIKSAIDPKLKLPIVVLPALKTKTVPVLDGSQPVGNPKKQRRKSKQTNHPTVNPQQSFGNSHQPIGDGNQAFAYPQNPVGYSNQACLYPVSPFENLNQTCADPCLPTVSHQPYQPYLDPPPPYSACALPPPTPEPEHYQDEL
ncbi:arrestin domain-containing protein 3-like [Synchiropus splendidus]|uniref:arrestin domain-containing protein 3-like n=1 Tax=Synchiropus splendidus TaxID=270530 RepID=UPI00237EE5F9|nr:arrestin domain-containing protein 3-like [Synchiropus splendidus]